MNIRMEYDDVAWERSDEIADAWRAKLFETETMRAVGDFMVKHCVGAPFQLNAPVAGAFNVVFRMEFKHGGQVVMRIPVPGVAMFPEEKVRNEVAVMRYLQAHTAIPIPFILHWGTAEECPGNLGPFIIMEYTEHAFNMTAALNTPGKVREDRPVLDPNISIERLELLYGQVADILLQLYQLPFPKIGSLAEVEDDEWDVIQRPLTFNMNQLVQLGTLPRSKLPTSTFETSSSYFASLADLNIDHLALQRNDAIGDAADCRRRYISRHLFRKLARGSRLSSKEYENGPFRLWCDDLRPSNILLNADYQIVAVIDWEFTYAAPAEYSQSPPWWLLIEQPEFWTDKGMEEWTKIYGDRLNIFLRVLRAREQDRIERGILDRENILSDHMERSWTSGDFWISYAARKSFAFDTVFFKYIDERFFGDREAGLKALETRAELLDETEREAMDAFVDMKLKQMETRELAWEPFELKET